MADDQNITSSDQTHDQPGPNPALKSLDFPLMRELYAKAPLTREEQYALKAYLWSLSRDGTPPRRDRDFVYLGVVGMLVALGFIGLVWGGRKGGEPHS